MSFVKFKRSVGEGDTVILYVAVSQIYAIEVKPSIKNKHGQFVEYTLQTKYGALRVMDLIGKEFGSKVQLSKGYIHILYPTPELWTLTLPHRTQILYTPDISLVITELEIHPGSVVCEAGTGSGSLSHAILRAIGPNGHLHTCDFHQERVEVATAEFEKHGLASRVTVEQRDVCADGWSINEVADAVFLDLPKPWEALPHAVRAIGKSGGRICSFSPCIEQVSKACEVMRHLGLTEINTVECLQREFQFKSMELPPVYVKKVPVPSLQADKEKNNDESNKRLKSSTEDISIPANVDSNISIPANIDSKADDSTAEEDPNVQILIQNSESFSDTSKCDKNYKFCTGIPLLKMPGHTGYLTFATVPPSIKRNFKICQT